MRPLVFALGLALLLALTAACGGGNTEGSSSGSVFASVLIEAAEDSASWFRGVEVPEGTDGYELLVAVTDGEVEAEWSSEFQSHFVQSVLGVAPEGDEFWGVFLWNAQSDTWEPLPTAADFYDVEDGSVMGWALVEYSPDTMNLPSSRP